MPVLSQEVRTQVIELPAAKVEAFSDRVYVTIPRDYMDGWSIIREWLKLHKVNQLYVKIGKVRKPRTTGEKSQNSHCNGHIQQMANFTGDYFDDIKRSIKIKAIAKGYPYKTNSFGKVVPISESEASTVECGYLIDTCHEVASFLGCNLKEERDE